MSREFWVRFIASEVVCEIWLGGQVLTTWGATRVSGLPKGDRKVVRHYQGRREREGSSTLTEKDVTGILVFGTGLQ